MRTAAVLVLLLLAGCHYPPATDPCNPPTPPNPGVRPADTGVVVGKVKVVCVDTAR